MYHQSYETLVHEKDIAITNWFKLLVSMGYTDEQVETLMKEYYGDWTSRLPKDDTAF